MRDLDLERTALSPCSLDLDLDRPLLCDDVCDDEAPIEPRRPIRPFLSGPPDSTCASMFSYILANAASSIASGMIIYFTTHYVIE
mmetsp:Transcript_12357/g.16197  ORF Transcript_12357/g.16197 Transcript_12357/m.16197 type:complete len:85 (-) Transcript_12357:286-540(-)